MRDVTRDDRCAFCGRRRAAVRRLISGPGHVFICQGCVVQCVELLADEQLLPVRNRLVQQLAEVARRYPEDAELQAVVGPIVTTIAGPCAEVAELEAKHAEARQQILRLRGQLAHLAARGH